MANLDIKKIIASGDINSLPEYSYGFKGKLNKQSFDFCVSPKEMKNKNTITAIFPEISLVVNRSYEFSDVLTEVITITNNGDYVLKFDNIMMGFKVDVDTNSDIKLSAVPYKIQQDGWRHIYSMNTLINGRYAHIINGIFPEGDVYGNSVYSDHNRPEFCRPEPELVDRGILRSEGWTLGNDSGVLAIKHNEKDIEYCLVEPKDDHLVFAGTGLCLYGEPDAATVLQPGESFTFGETILTRAKTSPIIYIGSCLTITATVSLQITTLPYTGTSCMISAGIIPIPKTFLLITAKRTFSRKLRKQLNAGAKPCTLIPVGNLPKA